MKLYLTAVLHTLFFTNLALAEPQATSQISSDFNAIRSMKYPKADFLLRQLIVRHESNKKLNKLRAAKSPETMVFASIHESKVLVDISVNGDGKEILSSLKSLGLEHASQYKNIISGYIHLDKIEKLMEHKGVVFVQVSLVKNSVGLTTTQGDISMHTDTARVNYSVNGSPVKVGTLSDSYNALGGAPADVVSNDLPPDVVVLKEIPVIAEGTDEGRAMMQIVHDIAPGSKQYFRSGTGGQADLAQGILDLVNAGMNVIVDDITFFDVPFFQDGYPAQAATNAIKDGVHYFSAAGNLNEHSYQAPFNSSGINAPVVGGIMHNFGGGDTFQQFTLPETPGDNVMLLVFQWNQPFKTVCEGSCPGATSNIDIYLRDQLSGTYVAGSEIDNPALGVPFEVIQYQNLGITPRVLELVIVLRSGPAPSLIKYILGAGPSADEFDTQSSSSFGLANGDRVISVGSTAFFNTPAFGVDPAVSNNASSLGGTPIYFDSRDNSALPVPLIRQTPDIAAPDGGNNTFFGNDSVNDVDTFPNFFGSSASAPHVAGLAALILDYSISVISPAQMESILEFSALDMGTAGYDYKSGFGLVQADGPFGAICGDVDGDSFCINEDECPSDPSKTEAGLCGCGQLEGSCPEDIDDPADEVVEEIFVPVPAGPFFPPPGFPGPGGLPPAPVVPSAPVSADSDEDGIPDHLDNCPNEVNPNQVDENKNGVGDVCESQPLTIEATISRPNQSLLNANEAPAYDDFNDESSDEEHSSCSSVGNPSSLIMVSVLALWLMKRLCRI